MLVALRRLREIADALGQPDCRDAIDATLATLPKGVLKVAVLGQFKRGKSSLLNALVGRDVLPTGILPVTSVATEVREGPGELRVAYAAGTTSQEPIGRIADFVSEEGNPENRRGISRVEVAIPLPGWARDVIFVDHPGVGSVHDATTREAHRQLDGVEAAVFVLSPDPVISEVELAFLRRATEHATRFFFVMNKVDLIGPTELESVVRYTERTLVERAGISRPHLYRLSARAARRIRSRVAPAADGTAGFQELSADLARYLGEERAQSIAAVGERRVEQFARRIAGIAELALRSAAASRESFEATSRALDRSVEELRTELRAADALLDQDLTVALEAVTARLARFPLDAGGAIVARLTEVMRSSTAIASGRLVREFEEALRDLVLPRAAEIRATLERQLGDALRAGFERHRRRVRALIRHVEDTATGSFGVRLFPIEADAPLPDLPGYRPGVTGLLEGTFAGQTVLMLPAALVRGRLRARLTRLVAEELDAQAGRIRSDLVDRGTAAVRGFQGQVATEVDRNVASIEAALRFGREQDRTGADVREDWRRRLEGWRSESEALLRRSHAGPGTGGPEPGGRSDAASG